MSFTKFNSRGKKEGGNKSRKLWSKVFWWLVVILFFALLLEAGLTYYDRWRGQEDIKDLAQSLEDYDKAVYELMANDKVGGSTPQETLNLFIEAVEAGDYEMASRYFVVDKQEQWKEDLSTAKKNNELIKLLNEALGTEGEYSSDEDLFSFYNPIVIDFILYPSGNWKIEEI